MSARLKKQLRFILLLSLFIGFDQVAKIVAKDYLALLQPISYLYDIFRLQYVENAGAFLSLGWTWPQGIRFWMLTVCVGMLLGSMLIFMIIKPGKSLSQQVAYSLILGGGFGNLMDRIFNDGKVVDFMNIGIGNIRTGIFNFADVLILLGLATLLHVISKSDKKEKTCTSN
jgi:signal peptidase II